MRFQIIYNKEIGEKIVGMFETEDIEYVDPIKYYSEIYIGQKLVINNVPFEELNNESPPISSFFKKLQIG